MVHNLQLRIKLIRLCMCKEVNWGEKEQYKDILKCKHIITYIARVSNSWCRPSLNGEGMGPAHDASAPWAVSLTSLIYRNSLIENKVDVGLLVAPQVLKGAPFGV